MAFPRENEDWLKSLSEAAAVMRLMGTGFFGKGFAAVS